MVKLKTLKDLDWYCTCGHDCECKGDIYCNAITIANLKQEAIKHIKSGKMVEGAKHWAIKFFNITEEDLSENNDSHKQK